MKMIGSIDYELESYVCHPASAAAPFDPGSHHNKDRGGKHDGDPADDAPHSGTPPARSAATPQHRLNVTV
jgi:hypothetical protein